jgi:hypothetical protein
VDLLLRRIGVGGVKDAQASPSSPQTIMAAPPSWMQGVAAHLFHGRASTSNPVDTPKKERLP